MGRALASYTAMANCCYPLGGRAAQALGISRRVLGPDHLDTASSCNNLAGVMQALGRYDEAEQLLKRWGRTAQPACPEARTQALCGTHARTHALRRTVICARWLVASG